MKGFYKLLFFFFLENYKLLQNAITEYYLKTKATFNSTEMDALIKSQQPSMLSEIV